MAGRVVRTHDDSRLYTLAGPILSGIVLKAIRAERRARDIGAAELSGDFVRESETKYHRHLAAIGKFGQRNGNVRADDTGDEVHLVELHQFVELLDTNTGRELIIGADNLDSTTGNLASVLGDCDLETAVETLGDRRVDTFVGQDQANLNRALILSMGRNTDSGREDGYCTENSARTFLERECQANLPIAVADLIPPQDSSLAAAICGNPARTVIAIVIDQQTASHLQQSAATYETTPFYRNALSHAFSAKNKSLQGITGKSLSPLAKRRRRQARRLPETCRKMLCVTKTGRKRHVGNTILSFRKSALRLVDPQRKHVMIRR